MIFFPSGARARRTLSQRVADGSHAGLTNLIRSQIVRQIERTVKGTFEWAGAPQPTDVLGSAARDAAERARHAAEALHHTRGRAGAWPNTGLQRVRGQAGGGAS